MAGGGRNAMADLDALVIFAKVAEAKSFSEAARGLKMPVSTVSRRVADLEGQLGVRLLERSSRSLRLTDIGVEFLDHARRTAEISQAVEALASNKLSTVSGQLNLSAPPSIAETLLVPLITAFQAAYPEVYVHVFVTDRYVDHVSEGIDLVFRRGDLKDSSLVARKLLTYRHQLVASPAYLSSRDMPRIPQDLLKHRLLGFSDRRPHSAWTLRSRAGEVETVSFSPYMSMNDYAGLAAALLAGKGIGDLPPLVRPDLMLNGALVEVMPDWRFRASDLSLVHLGNRHLSRPVRVFKEFAADMAPRVLGSLPS